MGRLSVTLCGIALDNPVIPASGTFGYGKEFSEFYDLDVLGSLSFKGTTLFPREGNPLPRIAEAPFGMLNAVGLQNPGAEAVLREELPALRRRFHKPVMANISGFSIDDYATTCAMLEQDESVGWLEVNISCPNVHGGGMSFGTDPKQAADCESLRGGGGGRTQPHQYSHRPAHRPQNPAAGAEKRHRGTLRPRGLPHRPACRVAGV